MKIGRMLLALACLVGIGCNAHMSVEDYSHAWRLTALKYRALNKHPEYTPTITPDETQAQAVSRGALELGNKLQDLADEIKGLDAPDSMANVQEQTFLFYQGQADDYRIYAAAITSGDQSRVQEAEDALGNYLDEHQKSVMAEIAKLGGLSNQFAQPWTDIFKDLSEKQKSKLGL